MKYIFCKMIIPLMAATVILGCSDTLDKSPLDQLSSGTAWASEENAMIVLHGAYRGGIAYNGEVYDVDDCWGYYGWVFFENASDNVLDRRRAGSPFEAIINGNLNANNQFVGSYWSRYYQRITRCNDVLDNIDKVPMPDDNRERMRAEARFLRASQYFYLTQFYWDVPLVETVLNGEEANNVKKTDKTALTGWIITELTQAAEKLPRHKDIKAGERGRASKQAALAFLGRTQLAAQKYADAAKTYEEIIGYGDNIIDPDYRTIFLASNEASNENIFVAGYKEDVAGNPLPQQAFPNKNGGWCFACPTASLFEAYQFTNGEDFSYHNPLYDPKDLEKNRDPRLKYTLMCDNASFMGTKYISHPDSTLIWSGGARISNSDAVKIGTQTTQTGFLLRKFFDESKSNFKLTSGYGNDFPIIRYAEVLLSYLEAKLEAGDAISQTLLNATINQVRGRANVNMPPVTETDPAKLRAILRNERRVELAMEGIRYWDLLRWNTAHIALQGKVYGAPFPGAKNLNGSDPDGRWDTDITRTFRASQDYRWPIPQSEQNINPNLR